MDAVIIEKLVFSVVSFGLVSICAQLLKNYAKKTQRDLNIQKSRYFALNRLITLLSTMLIVILLILIWGINLKNLWGSLTGILAMIAVAFFAVWSLIGNILAGLILFFTSPFKINDHIEVLPDSIQGKVLAINTFYTVVMDEEGNYISIPNSLFFQKYVKKFKKGKI